MSNKPVLGYWDIRGYVQQSRLLLKYLNVDFEDKLYGFGSGPEPTADSWYDEKFNHGLDFPNIPYFKDGSFQVTESKAILRYIAATRAPELLPATPEDQGVSHMVEGVVTDLLKQLTMYAYDQDGKSETPLEEALVPKFELLNKFLESKDYILGKKMTYNDFLVYEVLHQFTVFNSEFLKPYPALEKYIQRFESLPQIADFVKATANYVCYSPFAKIRF